MLLFQYLPFQDILRFQSVCSLWSKCSLHDSIWRIKCLEKWPSLQTFATLEEVRSFLGKSYREIFRVWLRLSMHSCAVPSTHSSKRLRFSLDDIIVCLEFRVSDLVIFERVQSGSSLFRDSQCHLQANSKSLPVSVNFENLTGPLSFFCSMPTLIGCFPC
jgi:hypothetical protein